LDYVVGAGRINAYKSYLLAKQGKLPKEPSKLKFKCPFTRDYMQKAETGLEDKLLIVSYVCPKCGFIANFHKELLEGGLNAKY
jgi:predicted RNA-binding Zn-ribbon protein involved in translation (DUF1610 family)